MTNLSVNVNKIAWLRNARGEGKPDLIEMSKVLIDCGVAGLTVHPRPDLRHITPDDVYELSVLCKDKRVEFNIEGNPFSGETAIYPGFLRLVNETSPDQCTLVPDSEDQLTSDHGWNITEKDHNKILDLISQIPNETRKSFFVDPVESHIEAINKLGPDRIELYTGPYASNPNADSIAPYVKAYTYAKKLGLGVNAGHDLDLNNLKFFLSKVPAEEVSIGHALISDALIHGLEKTTLKYIDLCK